MRSGASGVARFDAFPHAWRARDALTREPPFQASDGCVPSQRLGCVDRVPARPAMHVSMRFRHRIAQERVPHNGLRLRNVASTKIMLVLVIEYRLS